MTSRAGFKSGTSFTIDAKSQKAFLPSNFRIRLDGVPLSHVDKVDAITIKQKVSYGPGSFPAYHLTPDPVISEGVTTEFRGLIEAGPFEEGVRLALQGIDIDHSVEIEYFNERGDSLLVVKQALGVFKVTPEKGESQGDSLRVTLISDRDTVSFLWPKVSVR